MFKKILVAINQDDLTEKIISSSIELSKRIGSSLFVIHVLSPHIEDSGDISIGYDTDLWPLDAEDFYAYHERWMDYQSRTREWLSAITSTKDIKIEYALQIGFPGIEICSMAKSQEADLIIMGRHEKKGISELILGSVSNYVVHHSPCDVLLVHNN